MPFPPIERLQPMIAQAMEARAPRMYQRLKANGELEAVVKMRAVAATQAYQDAAVEMSESEVRELMKAQQDDPWMGAPRYITMRESRLAETALAQAMGFPAETTEPSPGA